MITKHLDRAQSIRRTQQTLSNLRFLWEPFPGCASVPPLDGELGYSAKGFTPPQLTIPLISKLWPFVSESPSKIYLQGPALFTSVTPGPGSTNHGTQQEPT